MSEATVNLRELRVNRGLGLDEAADAIGVHRTVLARTEAGSVPQPKNAFKIARFYGHQVTDIWPVNESVPA